MDYRHFFPPRTPTVQAPPNFFFGFSSNAAWSPWLFYSVVGVRWEIRSLSAHSPGICNWQSRNRGSDLQRIQIGTENKYNKINIENKHSCRSSLLLSLQLCCAPAGTVLQRVNQIKVRRKITECRLIITTSRLALLGWRCAKSHFFTMGRLQWKDTLWVTITLRWEIHYVTLGQQWLAC